MGMVLPGLAGALLLLLGQFVPESPRFLMAPWSHVGESWWLFWGLTYLENG